MAIRYDKKFMSEINKTVSAYNRKITRLAKGNVKYNLPKKFTKEDLQTLKNRSITRSEVRRKLKSLQSFTARGGEKNVKVGSNIIPQYLLTNIKNYQRLLKLQTTKKLKEYETRHPVQDALEQPMTFAQYGSQEYLTLKAKRMTLLDKDLEIMSQGDLTSYLEKLEANTRGKDLNVWKNNYLGMLEETALSYGYDPDKLDIIVSRFKELSPEDFDDLTFVNRNIKDVVFKYKILRDIQTSQELMAIGEDVIANLDSILENLDDILAKYE